MSRRTLYLLLLIWIAFVVRGTFYSLLIPLWEGFDEYSHFDFIEYLSNGNGLPSPEHRISAEISRSLRLAPAPLTLNYLSLTTHDDFWQLPESERALRTDALKQLSPGLQRETGSERMLESKQPPLHYWTATAVLWFFRAASLIDRVFLARLCSVFIASSVVFLSFIAARLFFNDEGTGLQIAALITVMPQLFISVSRVSNEPLAVALFSVLACCLILVAKGHDLAILAAILILGLGLLTKAYFVAAVPAVLIAVLFVLWRADKATRLRLFLQILVAGAVSLAICGWWYARNLGVGGPIWEDAVPAGGNAEGVLQSLVSMQWYRALDFTFYSHVWLGGWSFLSIRSWIYHVFMYGIWLGLGIAAVYVLRHLRNRSATFNAAALLGLLYSGFLASLLYHAYVSFRRVQHPASGGHYLYAAIIPEALIVIFGFWQLVPARWRSHVLTLVTAAFAMLDIYTSHFVALPYYTGMIRHTANGSLPAFHIGDAGALGLHEIVARLLINRPAAFGPQLLLCIWGASVIFTVSLPWTSRFHRKAS